jgi:Tfp pilus assembly protein PilF
LKKITPALLAVLVLVAAATTLSAAEDWRGNNRLSGSVVDAKSGAPVKGAKLSLRIQKGTRGGPDLTTDNNGRWAIPGLGAGPWNIDVQADGYALRQLSTAVQEGQRLPPMKIEIEPAAPVAAAADAAPAPEQIRIGGQPVTKEVADAVEAGNTFLGEKKFKEAAAEYEKAVAAVPTAMPLQLALARSYYGAGDLKKAIAAMDIVHQADPTEVQKSLLYANMLLENGQLDAGKAIVEKLPAGALTDPTPIINIGIVMMNKKQPAAAGEYFTKALAIDPNSVDGYYYRGLASIQAGKAKQARPDLQKVIELAPTSDQAKDAKEYLKSIK